MCLRCSTEFLQVDPQVLVHNQGHTWQQVLTNLDPQTLVHNQGHARQQAANNTNKQVHKAEPAEPDVVLGHSDRAEPESKTGRQPAALPPGHPPVPTKGQWQGRTAGGAVTGTDV